MLLNPCGSLPVLPGTRMLSEGFGVVGLCVDDPKTFRRKWTVTKLYAPIQGRALGGIRVRLADNKGFVSFCNQRDFELMMEIAAPGQWCPWTNEEYPGINDPEFYGPCMDEEDLLDDLYERELELRANFPHPWLASNTEITRRIHLDAKDDAEELQILLWDMDPYTGDYPDPRFETLQRRWSRVERRRLMWTRLP